MYYEIYIDTLFIINFMMDFLVLWTVGKLLKQITTWLKLISASAAGAFVICIIVIFPISNIMINIFIYYVLTSLLMIFIAFRPKNIKQTIKLIISLYLITFLIGGSIVSLYYYTKVGYYVNQIINGNIVGSIDFNTFFLASLIAFIIIKMILHYFSRVMTVQKNLYAAEIYMNGKKIEVQGLLDTGNNLYDPITKSPVIIVEYDAIKEIIPENVRNIIYDFINNNSTSFYEQMGELHEYKIRLIPFSSIGESGMLIGMVSETVTISLDYEKEFKLNDIVLAVYNKKLSQDNSYQILLHPKMIQD
ncbi:MAG: sigma-E processing peptidase SpoIIGA [bacterium]